MRVLILGYQKRAGVEEAVEALRPLIRLHAEIVCEDLTGNQNLAEVRADVALLFGGDGSILRAIKQMGRNQLPFIAVNLGRLGFLANTHKDDLAPYLSALNEFILMRGPTWAKDIIESNLFGIPSALKSHFTIAEHTLLECVVCDGQGKNARTLASDLVINEVAIQNASFRIMEVQLFADDELVTTYSADGLILATPFGSTAHSLSAGGPILRHGLASVVISPVAPHTLTYRPVVDFAYRTYRLRVLSPGLKTSVVVDGRILAPLSTSKCVVVRPSSISCQMINFPGYSYYTTLQKKLGWGGQPRYNHGNTEKGDEA